MKQIYVIKNLINDKVYVGQADSAYDRFRRHRNNHLSAGKQNLEIVKAMIELGKDNFFYSILENCEDSIANEREQHYIEMFDSYRNGYNRTLGGEGFSTVLPEDIEECCKLFEQGKTNAEIETLTGISHKLFSKELQKRYPDYKERMNRNVDVARRASIAKPVVQYSLDGKFIRKYRSAREALEHLGKPIGASGISRCCKHMKHHETAYGYRWEYDTQ